MSKTHRIVVGVDGSEASARALRWAAYLGRTMGAAIEAVTAWQYPPSSVMPTEGSFDPEVAGRRLLDETVDTVLGPAGVMVNRRFIWASTGPALVEESADALLLVVGSRAQGELVGMLLGSVGQYVAAHARCPVLIVRDDDPPTT